MRIILCRLGCFLSLFFKKEEIIVGLVAILCRFGCFLFLFLFFKEEKIIVGLVANYWYCSSQAPFEIKTCSLY